MAVYSGMGGSVLAGTVVVGEIAEWSLSISRSTVDTTAFGDTWTERIISVADVTGSFSGNADFADAGQTLIVSNMLAGSALALKLYQNATKYWSVGTALITGLNPVISNSGKGEISYDFEGSGAATLT